MEIIIVFTDFSEASMNAARYAARLSKAVGISRILLYHSYDYVPLPADVPVTEIDTILAHDRSLIDLEVVEREMVLLLGSEINIIIDLMMNERPLVF